MNAPLHERTGSALRGLATDELERDGVDDLRAAIVLQLQQLERPVRLYDRDMAPPSWKDWSLLAVSIVKILEAMDAAAIVDPVEEAKPPTAIEPERARRRAYQDKIAALRRRPKGAA